MRFIAAPLPDGTVVVTGGYFDKWDNFLATAELYRLDTSDTGTLTLTSTIGGHASGGGIYPVGTTATLTATPDSGYVFTGGTVDGAPAGWHNPLTITMDADHAVGAHFGAARTFCDVDGRTPYNRAIGQLAARGVIAGYANGCFGPNDTALRAQMAALIARAVGWEAEDWGNPFTDRGPVDDALWRNVGTLAHYEVARGYDAAACRARRLAPPC